MSKRVECPALISSPPQVLLSLRLLLMMKPHVLSRVSREVAYGLHELLKTNAANIHCTDDWYTLFSLLECVGAGVKPPASFQLVSTTNSHDTGLDFSQHHGLAGPNFQTQLPMLNLLQLCIKNCTKISCSHFHTHLHASTSSFMPSCVSDVCHKHTSLYLVARWVKNRLIGRCSKGNSEIICIRLSLKSRWFFFCHLYLIEYSFFFFPQSVCSIFLYNAEMWSYGLYLYLVGLK